MKDLTVIGAGFGGLAAALTAAEAGRSVVLLERLGYPGGCASTFERRGHRFESGATLFSGFDPHQLFARWIARHQLDVTFEPLDPVITLRTSQFELPVDRDRTSFVERMSTLCGSSDVARYFEYQKKVADTLWTLFDQPELLNLNVRSVATLSTRANKFLPILMRANETIADVMRRYRVWRYEPMRTFANAVCQITVQASADDALATFALPAMDYFFRGTGHIRGGIGQLATAIWDRLGELGVETHYYREAKALSRGETWMTEVRKETFASRFVAANLQPSAVSSLLGDRVAPDRQRDVERGWGAAMLYRVIEDAPSLPRGAFHLELVDDPSAPFQEGNHIFCSVGADDESAVRGTRAMTISTHIPAQFVMLEGERAAHYYDAVSETMRATLAKLAPELVGPLELEMTASPRTFARFVGRPNGFVGGVPKTSLRQIADIRPLQPRPGLYIVGDTAFPGQSTLAAAIGGSLAVRSMFA